MIIPAGFAQLNFYFTMENTIRGAEVTWGVELLDLGKDAQTIADNARVAWEESLLLVQSSFIRLEKVRAKLGPNSTGLAAESPSGVSGSVDSQPEAPNTAVLINKVTGVGGRRGRGRTYLPGAPTNQVGYDGFVTEDYRDDVQAAVVLFMSKLEADDLGSVLLHAAGETATPAPSNITSTSVSTLAATQRRRLRK